MTGTVSGGPSRPSILLQNAVAVNAGATLTAGEVSVQGFETAVVEVLTDQASNTLTVRGSGIEPLATTPPVLTNYQGGTGQSINNLAVSTSGSAFIINVRGLAAIKVYVVNGAGATATVTVRVTLSPR